MLNSIRPSVSLSLATSSGSVCGYDFSLFDAFRAAAAAFYSLLPSFLLLTTVLVVGVVLYIYLTAMGSVVSSSLVERLRDAVVARARTLLSRDELELRPFA